MSLSTAFPGCTNTKIVDSSALLQRMLSINAQSGKEIQSGFVYRIEYFNGLFREQLISLMQYKLQSPVKMINLLKRFQIYTDVTKPFHSTQ